MLHVLQELRRLPLDETFMNWSGEEIRAETIIHMQKELSCLCNTDRSTEQV
jgi:hypothetical protein